MGALAPRKEVQDIPDGFLVSLVKLGVFALGAGDGGEFFGLNIENLGQKASGRPEFTALESGMTAFCAFETPVHRHSFLRNRRWISYTTRS